MSSSSSSSSSALPRKRAPAEAAAAVERTAAAMPASQAPRTETSKRRKSSGKPPIPRAVPMRGQLNPLDNDDAAAAAAPSSLSARDSSTSRDRHPLSQRKIARLDKDGTVRIEPLWAETKIPPPHIPTRFFPQSLVAKDALFRVDYAHALDAAKRTLREWGEESQTRVALGEHFTQEWAEQDVRARSEEEEGREDSAALSLTDEERKHRDLLLSYAVHRRAGLLAGGKSSSNNNATRQHPPPAAPPVSAPLHNKPRLLAHYVQIEDAVARLRGEADRQNAVNEAGLQALDSRVEAYYGASSPERSQDEFLQRDRPPPFDEALDAMFARRLVANEPRLLARNANLPFSVCHQCEAVVVVEEEAAGDPNSSNKGRVLDHPLGPAPECVKCRSRYCRSCLRKTYEQSLAAMSKPQWTCPRCAHLCYCDTCVRLRQIGKLKRLYPGLQ